MKFKEFLLNEASFGGYGSQATHSVLNLPRMDTHYLSAMFMPAGGFQGMNQVTSWMQNIQAQNDPDWITARILEKVGFIAENVVAALTGQGQANTSQYVGAQTDPPNSANPKSIIGIPIMDLVGHGLGGSSHGGKLTQQEFGKIQNTQVLIVDQNPATCSIHIDALRLQMNNLLRVLAKKYYKWQTASYYAGQMDQRLNQAATGGRVQLSTGAAGGLH